MEDEVFSKLPRSRPGVRSPNRGARKPAAKKKPAAQARTASGTRSSAKRGARKPVQPRPRTEPRAEPRQAPRGEPAHQPGGLEELARAGASAAFEAVGVGLRVGRWAVRGLRDTVERR